MSTVDQIKEKLNIADVVGRYIKLEKAGANLKAKCPFHQEKTPSFFVSPNRGSYYCFGCGVKGDIFTFVEEFERVDFSGALKILAEQAGVPIVYERAADKKEKSEKERLLAVMEEATDFYASQLGKAPAAADYLRGRGLKERTISDWQLGYAEDGWANLLDHLKSKGFKEAEIEKAGLIKKGERENGGFYDRFRARLMFPIFDSSGRPIAFSGRILDSNSKEAKYVNSPEGLLFNKSSVLYGYDRAKNAIRELNYTILVEGQMDLLMMHQAGLRNTVASSGTALTDEHLKILRRSSENLLLSYDGDGAGLKAALRAWHLALAMGMEVKIADIPKGEDPASILSKNPELMKTALKNSQHIINYYLDRVIGETGDKRKLAKAIEKEVLPLVRSLSSSIDQAHFISTISHQTGLPEEALYEELNKIEIEEESIRSEIRKHQDFLARRLWGLIFWQENQKSAVLNLAEIKDRLRKLVGPDEYKERNGLSPDDRAELIFEAELFYQDNPNLDKEVEELLRQVEREQLKQKFSKLMLELQLAEKNKDTEGVARLLKNVQELSAALNI